MISPPVDPSPVLAASYVPTVTVDTLSGIGLGTWPEWVAAALTGLAFVIAAVSLALEVSRRRRAQARLVYSEMRNVSTVVKGANFPVLADGGTLLFSGGNYSEGESLPLNVEDEQGRDLYIASHDRVIYTVAVRNVSDELITRAVVRIHLDNEVAAAGDIGTVPPHSETVAEFHASARSQSLLIVIAHEVVFRDAAGHWWLREEAQPVERIHQDPESPMWHTAPKATQISIRVRAARLSRRLRGKRAIP